MNALMRAHRSLRHELAAALREDPARVVRAPGFGKPTTAADAVLDDFSSEHGEQHLHSLLQILGRAARGEDVHLVAACWISAASERHAVLHRDDLAHQWQEAA